MILNRLKFWYKQTFSHRKEFIKFIGNGQLNCFYICHDLNDTRVLIQVVDTYEQKVVFPKTEIVNENTICISFNNVPERERYRVTIIG